MEKPKRVIGRTVNYVISFRAKGKLFRSYYANRDNAMRDAKDFVESGVTNLCAVRVAK